MTFQRLADPVELRAVDLPGVQRLAKRHQLVLLPLNHPSGILPEPGDGPIPKDAQDEQPEDDEDLHQKFLMEHAHDSKFPRKRS